MNMRIVGVLSACVSLGLFAEEGAPDEVLEMSTWSDGIWGSANVDVNSHYVWRGTVLNDNPCWQPGAYLGYTHDAFGGVYVGVWTSFDLTHKVNDIVGSRRNCGMGELDYIVAYTKSLGDFDLELQNWFYTYPNDNGKPYNDIALIAKYNNEYVTPGLEVWWSYYSMIDNFDSCFWFNFFIAHDFTFFDDKLTISPKASLSFGDAAHQRDFVTDWKGTGADGSGAQLTDQTTTLRVNYAITDHFSVYAHMNFTWVPSSTLRDERWMYYGANDRSCLLWGGVGIAASF